MNKNWQEWLASNNRGWRLFVGAICTLALALFLHFREVRLEVLELNTVASRYVVAQVDFEFPDYEKMILLKQQAMQDVGSIYQVDDSQIRDARRDVEEELIRGKSWRRSAPLSTFEGMYKAADELETILLEARFTDPRTLQKIKELGSFASSYHGVEEGEKKVLSPTFWKRCEEKILSSGEFHPQTIGYVIRLFERHRFNLVEDSALERSIRAQVSRQVPEKMYKVAAGTRIIDQGELITSRHLTMMQSLKQAISESRKIWDSKTLLASLLLAVIFVTISGLYFRISQPTFIRSLREISLFVCIVIITLFFAKFLEYILLKSSSEVIEAVRYPIVAPFATILICILLSPKAALFGATFLSILLSVSLAVDHSRFLILNLVTSIVVIISSQKLRKRKEVFTVFMKTWLSAILVLLAFTLAENHLFTTSFFINIIASCVFLLFSAIFVVGLLPALETIFGVLTDMTLIEYTDPGSELLRSFAQEVPGTYQHSLVLGNLSETCAQAIGANGLFCRAATLYHDIGKIKNPQFYTENQQGNLDIHQLLTPLESAQVIISHVSDGVAIAKKRHLPEPFIDIIKEHHGTTLVYFFYRKQLELVGNRKEEVDESKFRYPGPKPKTKESAIIMICDSLEAATRSLDEINEKTLTQLVNRLVAEKMEDGQFDHCKLTFEEMTKVKKTLVKTLLLTHHVRIKYPKREGSS